MIKRVIATAGLTGLMGLLAGCAATTANDLGGKTSPQLSDGDNRYLTTVTQANKTEIEMGQAALSMTESNEVKKFAQMIIKDHTDAEAKTEELAAAVGFAPPTMLDSDHQAMIDGLKGKSFKDFDKTYLDDQITAHEQAIKATEDEANNGSNQQVKNLANELLPTLQKHLAAAKQLEAAGA